MNDAQITTTPISATTAKIDLMLFPLFQKEDQKNCLNLSSHSVRILATFATFLHLAISTGSILRNCAGVR